MNLIKFQQFKIHTSNNVVTAVITPYNLPTANLLLATFQEIKMGPRTQVAVEIFIEQSGIRLDFSEANALEKLVCALEKVKKPVCNLARPKRPVVKSQTTLNPPQVTRIPYLRDGKSLAGEWAVIQRCSKGGQVYVVRGRFSLAGGNKQQVRIIYDATYMSEHFDQFTGKLVETEVGTKRTSLYISMAGRPSNSTYMSKFLIDGGVVSADRDSINVDNNAVAEVPREFPQRACTLDAYRIKQ